MHITVLTEAESVDYTSGSQATSMTQTNKRKANKMKNTNTKQKTKKAKRDLYAEITNRVIASLEEGRVPWEMPWACAGARGFARSVSTGKVYTGVNQLLLSMSGYASPWWMTYKQATELEGVVRKGEKATTVVFWKFIEEVDKDTKKKTGKRIPILRHFNVFNAEQCELPKEAVAKLEKRLEKVAPMKVVNENEVIEEAQMISDNYLIREEIKLSHGGDSAHYTPALDSITMPTMESFKSSNHYYTTLFHEEVHSTGHSKRLNRGLDTNKENVQFGSGSYCREELVAEMGASFLCGLTGIANKSIDVNRNSYIKGFLKLLKEDKRAIIVASGKASKAVDLITGLPTEGDVE